MSTAGIYEHGRVELHNGNYLVWHHDGRSWAVMETGQRWEAWPYPECADPTFDDEDYRAVHLRGKHLDRATADEKIRELIGDPA
jgi:hypothetical protein